MDKGPSELTDRISSAIKKKLVEINAFVDNELPNYIMILVANKRSKSHMEKDLSLFLGDETAEFTNWLWDFVNNLNSSSNAKSVKQHKSEEHLDKKKSHIDEDSDVLDCDLNEQEDMFLYQDDISPNQVSAGNILSSKVSELLPPKKEINRGSHHRQINPKSAKVYPVKPVSRIPPCSSFVPIERQTFSREDEYDPTKPEFTGSVSSVVRATRKNYSIPAAFQANKLLLRAVDDATKSVLEGRRVNDSYQPTPIKMLSSTRREKKHGSRSSNLVNVKIDSDLDFNADQIQKDPEPSFIEENSNGTDIHICGNENYFLPERKQSRTICLASNPSDMSVQDVPSFPFLMNQHPAINVKEEEENSPHFIVTLDGVNLSSFKRKYTDSSEESMDIDPEDLAANEDILDANPEKKQKVTEKCKYWPICKNLDNCVYHHPTVPCKCFPECKYGDKCMYIHPNCKFDELCSRKDCPYTHLRKCKFSLPLIVSKPPVKNQSFKVVCKFYPKCSVKNCAFIHPKLCRYGTKCRLSTCIFTHMSIPSRNQMTWKADNSDSM